MMQLGQQQRENTVSRPTVFGRSTEWPHMSVTCQYPPASSTRLTPRSGPRAFGVALVTDGLGGGLDSLPTLAYDADLRRGGRARLQAVQYHRRWESGTSWRSLTCPTVTGSGRCSNHCS